MARPNKFNLSYFPMDVDFFEDHKIVLIEEKLGIKGGYIAVRIMAFVYASENGYYLDWPEKYEFTCAKRVGNGVTGALVWEVLQLALECGLFNRDMFSRFRIVTSAGIQKRWEKVMRDMRRKFRINPSFFLISSEETGISSEETTTPTTFSTQKEKKVDEKKLNEMKEDERLPALLEMFKRVTSGYDINYLKFECNRFLNKYPMCIVAQSGALVNSWAANMNRQQQEKWKSASEIKPRIPVKDSAASKIFEIANEKP